MRNLPLSPFRRSPRRADPWSVILTPDETDLVVRFAGAGRHRCAAASELQRRGHLGAPGLPIAAHAAPLAAFAQSLAAWTLGVVTPTDYRDTLVCLGGRHTVALDVEPTGMSVLSTRPRHAIPSLLADRMDLGPRPRLDGEVSVRRLTAIDRREELAADLSFWADLVEGTWPAVTDHLRGGRWRLVRLQRRWFDGEERADRLILLDTPAGYLRVVEDDPATPGYPSPGGVVVPLRPISAADVWAHVCGGPRPHRLHVAAARRWVFGRGCPGLARDLPGWRYERGELHPALADA